MESAERRSDSDANEIDKKIKMKKGKSVKEMLMPSND